MRHVVSLIFTVVFAWPALVIGYIFGAIKTGFEAGEILYDQHTENAVKFFTKHAKSKESSNG